METIVIRKRAITANDLNFIQSVVHENWDKGRTKISQILCRRWNWVQPNGQLKDMACREILLILHRKGLLDYPPAKQACTNGIKKDVPRIHVEQNPICCNISELEPVRIEMVRHTDKEALYNSLVDEFHYLGHAQIVGCNLKYMAFSGDTPLACVGWGSAAWAVNSREQFIGWSKTIKDQRLHFIANNTRFLVLPWICVKCLASIILALNIKRISADWFKLYHYPLYLLETFVEQDRFKGTCYRASNWTHVGQTIGTSKKGHKHLKHNNSLNESYDIASCQHLHNKNAFSTHSYIEDLPRLLTEVPRGTKRYIDVKKMRSAAERVNSVIKEDLKILNHPIVYNKNRADILAQITTIVLLIYKAFSFIARISALWAECIASKSDINENGSSRISVI